MPELSVCIPAYNRPRELIELLDSIDGQSADFEIVICEDHSPMREQITAAVEDFRRRAPHIRLHYHLNEKNLGYDGNLRRVVERASGKYCVFMGNDDLMHRGALARIQGAVAGENIGVVLRSYTSFDTDPNQIAEVFQYLAEDRFFPAGEQSIITFYRRSVVIPGMVVHRAAALQLSTDRYDGTLLYQLHLVANILTAKNGFYLREPIVNYRNGGTPFFGSSESEQGLYQPGKITTEHSLNFMRVLRCDLARLV
jgi:abequosyltransferase